MLLIIGSNFNKDIVSISRLAASEVFDRYGLIHKFCPVPGVTEIPAALKYFCSSKKILGYVLLGCVIKGETDHYYYVCKQFFEGVNLLTIEYSLALGNGVITCQDKLIGLKRAYQMGKSSALAALNMMNVRNLSNKPLFNE